MKPNKKCQKNLLDVLKEAIGCEYLSDLHAKAYARKIEEVLCSIATERFTVEEWQDAATYLIGPKIQGDTAQQVKDALCTAYAAS